MPPWPPSPPAGPDFRKILPANPRAHTTRRHYTMIGVLTALALAALALSLFGGLLARAGRVAGQTGDELRALAILANVLERHRGAAELPPAVTEKILAEETAAGADGEFLCRTQKRDGRLLLEIRRRHDDRKLAEVLL